MSRLEKLKHSLKTYTTDSYKKGLSGVEARIVVNNSFCNLDNFSDLQLDQIKEILTYENQEVIFEIQQTKIQLGMAFRYKNFSKIKWFKQKMAELEENLTICWLKGNKFPTGHLFLVREELDKHLIPYQLVDVRECSAKPVAYKWNKTPKAVRPYQDEMVDLAIINHRGVFESAVGTGKTYIAQMIIHALQVPVLVVVPSKDLGTQTYDDFVQAFGSKMVENVNTPGKATTTKPVRICTVHTLVALQKKEALEPLLKGLGMIIIDEVHHAGAKSYGDLLPYFDHIYYRFGFSGTFMRNDSRTLDMWGFLSTVLFKYSAAQATNEGYLTPLKVVVHTIEGIRSNTYHNEYTKNYCKNDELLKKIQFIVSDETSDKEQVLILVGRKEKSGHVIHEFLTRLGISNEYVSGDSKRDAVKSALSNFNSKKTRVLIGSSIIGEGIDVRSTDHLIMAQGGKSEIAITQAIGRAVRLYPDKEVAYVHDFRFQGTKYMEKHLDKRLAIYEKNFDGKLV